MQKGQLPFFFLNKQNRWWKWTCTGSNEPAREYILHLHLLLNLIFFKMSIYVGPHINRLSATFQWNVVVYVCFGDKPEGSWKTSPKVDKSCCMSVGKDATSSVGGTFKHSAITVSPERTPLEIWWSEATSNSCSSTPTKRRL